MLRLAQSPSSSTRFPPLLSKRLKLLIIFSIIIASYLSGKIPQLARLNESGEMLAEAAVNPVTNISEPSSAKGKHVQIKQISIGQTANPRPAPTQSPTPIPDNEWGVVKKIDTHTYTMLVRPDSRMSSAEEIFTALNNYRNRYNSASLVWDDRLADFASQRAGYFIQKNTLDNHDGFLDYLNNQDGFKKLGFSSLGENSSLGFTLEAIHLIEWVYAGDEEHDHNQLNSDWHYVGIGVSGNSTDLVFAGSKL